MADDTTIELDIEPGNTLTYLEELQARLGKVTASIEASEAWEQASDALEDVGDTADEITTDVDELADSLTVANSAIQDFGDNSAEVAGELQVYKDAVEAADDATMAHQEEMYALLDAEEELADSVGSVVEAVQEEAATVEVAANDFTDYADAVEESTTTTEDFQDKTEETRGILGRFGDMAKSVAGRIASMFVIDITRIPQLMAKIGKKLFGGSEEWEELTAQLDGLLHTIGAALLPVLEGLGQGFEVVAKAVKSVAPLIARLGRQFVTFASGTMEAIGGMVIPLFEQFKEIAIDVAASLVVSWNFLAETGTMLWEGLVDAFTGIMEMFGLTSGSATTMGEKITGVWDTIKDYTNVIFSFVQTVIENWQLACAAAVVKFALTAVTAFEEVKYFLTDVVPASLSWFGRQFVATFTDTADFLGECLSSMKDNIFNFFGAIASWLRGDGFDFRFRGLEEGFKNTLVEFPEMTDRQRSTIEQSLTDLDTALSSEFSTALSDKILENEKQFNSAREAIESALDTSGETPTLTLTPELEEEIKLEQPEQTPVGEVVTGKDVEKEETGLKGATGLAELAGGIQAALFNRTDDPTTEAVGKVEQRLTETAKEAAILAREQIAATKALNVPAKYA